MSLKYGVISSPNVGKSTLFNALPEAGIAAENHPVGWMIKKANCLTHFRHFIDTDWQIQDKNSSVIVIHMA